MISCFNFNAKFINIYQLILNHVIACPALGACLRIQPLATTCQIKALTTKIDHSKDMLFTEIEDCANAVLDGVLKSSKIKPSAQVLSQQQV